MRGERGHSATVTIAPAPEPDLLALLGHELRTPLNAIIGYADAMRAEAFGPLSQPYAQQAEVIHRAALHLLALIDDMAAIALPDGGPWITRTEWYEPGAVARAMADLLSPGSAAAIRVETGPAGDQILGDRRALAQILLNLIDNARKHTAPGGEIAVRVAREGRNLRVSVADSGSGGSAGPAPPKGAGLGLRLVRALCTRLGGVMVLEEGARGGLIARVTLPAFSEP